MIKHLVTSGCSFSDNFQGRWPQYLAEHFDAQLYNRGQGSAGNDWIADSAIYQVAMLLEQGVSPYNMGVAVMWSGIGRRGIHVSKDESPNWDKLTENRENQAQGNPVAFIDQPANTYFGPNHTVDNGWMIGSALCDFHNDEIKRMKQMYIARYKTNESLLIDSLNNWLKLQWFCDSKGIPLINMTYRNLHHYPHYPSPDYAPPALYVERYPHLAYLDDMIDYDLWLFHGDRDGMYEWCRDNEYTFYDDGVHPSPESHKLYVDQFIIPRLENLL